MHIDARMPAVDRCVLRAVLDRHVRERPAEVFAVFESGESWTPNTWDSSEAGLRIERKRRA